MRGGAMNKHVNGFIFNSIGELTCEPKLVTLSTLEDTLASLYRQGEYISASRIQHRVNMILDSEMYSASTEIRPNLLLIGSNSINI